MAGRLRPHASSERGRHRAADHLGHQPRAWSPPSTGARHVLGEIEAGTDRTPSAARALRSTWELEQKACRWNTVTVERIFIGSCTNARIEDLRRRGPRRGKGYKIDARIHEAIVVPGSQRGVKEQAQARRPGRDLHGRGLPVARVGLLDVSGHEPRPAAAGRTLRVDFWNRNFEGRQGKGGRTHLGQPEMAAAAAKCGGSSPTCAAGGSSADGDAFTSTRLVAPMESS